MEVIHSGFGDAKQKILKEDILRFIFTRHGKTHLNKKGVFQPWTPDGDQLCEEGTISAKRLGERLSEVPISRIYSSDWHRAIHTAQLINEELQPPLNEITISKKLRDFHFGILTGVPVESFKYLRPELFNMWRNDRYHFKAPEGDSFGNFYKEKKEVLQKIVEENRKGNVLIVAHNYVITCFIIASLGLPLEEYANINIKNTSISIVEFEEGNIPGKLSVFNDT